MCIKSSWQTFPLLLILMVMIFTNGVFADEGQVVSLDQAVEMALKNDSQVFTAKNNVDKAKLAVKMEVLKTWPQASVTDTYGDVLQNPFSINDPRYDQFSQFPNMLAVTITETIPTKLHLYGKTIPTSIEAAIWDQVSSEAQLQITETNTIYNTLTYYLNTLKAEQTVGYQETVVESNKTSLAIALEQLKQNKITKPDELKVENDLATATYTLEKNRSDYELALRQLGNQIGLKDIAGIKLSEPAFAVAQELPDIQQIKTNAIQKRLEMKQAEITILKAEQQLAQSQNQALPDLNFGYTFRNNDEAESMTISYSFLSGNINGNAQKSIGDTNFIQANQSNNWGISAINELTLKLTWNLDFGTPQNQIKQNQLLLANAKASGDQTRQTVEWDVDQAVAAYQLAIKKEAVSQQAIPYYQKQLEIKKLQLKLGMASELDVANAESSLLQAQNQAKSDGYDKLLAFKKLQMVSGDMYPFNNSGPKVK